MKLKIKLLKPFSDAIGKSEMELDFNGSSLDDLVKILVERYSKLKKEIYAETGELSDYICLFVNGKPMSALNGMKTELKNNDEILFFVPISGG
jgi:MoaD family protein